MNASRSPSARIATYEAVHGPMPGMSSSTRGVGAVGEVEVGRGQRADRGAAGARPGDLGVAQRRRRRPACGSAIPTATRAARRSAPPAARRSCAPPRRSPAGRESRARRSRSRRRARARAATAPRRRAARGRGRADSTSLTASRSASSSRSRRASGESSEAHRIEPSGSVRRYSPPDDLLDAGDGARAEEAEVEAEHGGVRLAALAGAIALAARGRGRRQERAVARQRAARTRRAAVDPGRAHGDDEGAVIAAVALVADAVKIEHACQTRRRPPA